MRVVVRLVIHSLLICSSVFTGSVALNAQQGTGPTSAPVPRFVRVTGSFHPANGLPVAPVETATLAIYAEETGGTPLWQETQSVTMGNGGQYTVLLGATSPDGLPVDLFTAGNGHWLAVHFERSGEIDQPRVLLASVPYALRASDADTLGGKPASAYLLVDRSVTSSSKTGPNSTSIAPSPATVNPGTANQIPKYVNSVDLGGSAVFDTGGFVGVNTSTPLDAMHVQFTNTAGNMTGFAVQNLGNTATSYSGMLFYDQNGALGQFQGFNNSTHEYRINNVATGGTINFMIGGSSKFLVSNTGDVSIPGNLMKGGSPFLHNSGSNNNTFAGVGAGYFTTTGAGNLGPGNTGVGFSSLASNWAGTSNSAVGGFALTANYTGSSNTATGYAALENNMTGDGNTAIGTSALLSNTSGTGNTALGASAGESATTGSGNIYIGANVFGVAGESNTMYLGRVGTQTKTFIAGVRGATTSFADAVTVMIDSQGQLGTVNSSRRFKQDIRDMGEASDGLMNLRPVTFRYVQPYADGSRPIEYGLIAEEVEDVYPDLVAHLADGRIETVQYHKINAMLLNEVQKQHRMLIEQRDQVEALRAEIERLKGWLNLRTPPQK